MRQMGTLSSLHWHEQGFWGLCWQPAPALLVRGVSPFLGRGRELVVSLYSMCLLRGCPWLSALGKGNEVTVRQLRLSELEIL